MAELNARYATALFELSLESGKLDECFEQALTVRDVLKTEDCRKVIGHPHISAVEKRAFLHEAFGGGLNEQLSGFLHLLIAKNREAIMASSLSAFIEMADSYSALYRLLSLTTNRPRPCKAHCQGNWANR